MATTIFARIKRISKRLKDAIKRYNFHRDVLIKLGITKYPECNLEDAKNMATEFWELHERLSGITGTIEEQRCTRTIIDSYNLKSRCQEELILLLMEMKSMLSVDEIMLHSIKEELDRLSLPTDQQTRYHLGYILYLNSVLEKIRREQAVHRTHFQSYIDVNNNEATDDISRGVEDTEERQRLPIYQTQNDEAERDYFHQVADEHNFGWDWETSSEDDSDQDGEEDDSDQDGDENDDALMHL